MKKTVIKHLIPSRAFTFAVAVGFGSLLTSVPVLAAASDDAIMDRSQLPIKAPKIPHSNIVDVRNARAPERFEVKAPTGSPNVLIILLDDVGFGQPSIFGGPIKMPTAERLAAGGLRYNHFHTTALSSPTRAALLTGRNSHMNNTGSIMELATGFPGQTGVRPDSIAPLAKVLRYNGYSTAQFGKNHETPIWEQSTSGPFDRWPTYNGFDKFYGFMGGETNQWRPAVYEDLTRVEIPDDPNYHFMTDMTNHAIKWVKSQQSFTPDKPFFMYFAPGAIHTPHHVPKIWSDRYKGKFDQGWDELRKETLQRQIKLGVVPEGTQLAPKPKGIKDWEKLSSEERKLFTRQMEIVAGFGEYADYEIGRLVNAISEVGALENTLVFYILGDNGASAEGGLIGSFNKMSYSNGVREPLDVILQHYDDLGTDKAYGHYAAGWAIAGSTPFTWPKQVAANYGGTRNGMIVHWPKQIKAKGELRTQWHHVVDIVPTILESTRLPEPSMVDGILQTPIEGVSMLYTLNDAKADGRHLTQYFEILGNRAIYHEGWLAGTVHRVPWELSAGVSFENDRWELYDTRNDFSLANDLASKLPAKLKEMQDLFTSEAIKHNVFPLDDRTLQRLDYRIVGRPNLIGDRSSITFYEGMEDINEGVFINIKNQSHMVVANLYIPEEGANGVIMAQAGRFGGWSLYLKNGIPYYTYNWLGLHRYTIAGSSALPVGNNVTLTFDFLYDGNGLGKGGMGRLLVNGSKVAEGRIEQTQMYRFMAEEGADVGLDDGTPVIEDYGMLSPYRFTGKIHKIIVHNQKSRSETI
ncbi:MAG: arylsulfatase [Oligoflexia bacterium]|nr:arylsulfatase [Oligoflexia bacterium]MBF0366149.1 arylsulfatase [Oligoflexia bacterium]